MNGFPNVLPLMPNLIDGGRTFVAVHRVERVAEWFALVTCLVVGLSHLLQRQGWVEVFAALHRHGKV